MLAKPNAAVRELAAPIGIGATLVLVFVWLFAAALHAPVPTNLPVALVAPDQASAQIEAGLQQRAPGAFAVTRYGSLDAARQAVDDRTVAGGFVLGQGTATILVAGGAGEASAAAIEGAFGSIASGMGVKATISDLHPLPSSDPHGLVPFFLILGVAISSIVYAVASSFLSKGPLAPRLAGLLIFAALDGLAAALAVALVLGYENADWGLAAVCGVLALAIAATTLALRGLVGIAGLGLSALFVVILGLASSGAMLGPEFLPGAFRTLTIVLPPGAALAAVRGVWYFNGAAIAVPLASLAGWIIFALVVLIGSDAWRARRASRPVRE
ncbi:MAG: hypothetical protein ABSC46_01195 [Candidatus Limnocylindrales bacterium]|jgi:hypothetical protein